MPKHFTVTFLFIGIGLHAMHSPNQITKTGSNQLDFKEHMIRIIEDKFHRLPSLKVEFHDVDDPGIVDQIAFVPSNRSTIRRARNFGDGTFGLILGSYGLLHSNQSYIFREGNLRIRFYSEHQAATIDSRLLESLAWDVDMMMDPKMTERMSRIEIFFVVNRIPIGDIPSRSHPRILSAWDWLFRNRWDHDLKEQIRIYMGPTMRPEDNKANFPCSLEITIFMQLPAPQTRNDYSCVFWDPRTRIIGNRSLFGALRLTPNIASLPDAVLNLLIQFASEQCDNCGQEMHDYRQSIQKTLQEIEWVQIGTNYFCKPCFYEYDDWKLEAATCIDCNRETMETFMKDEWLCSGDTHKVCDKCFAQNEKKYGIALVGLGTRCCNCLGMDSAHIQEYKTRSREAANGT